MARSGNTSRHASSTPSASHSMSQSQPTPPLPQPQPQPEVRRMKSFAQRLRKISMPSLSSFAAAQQPPVQEKPRPRNAYVPTHAASSFARTTITPLSSTFIDERDEWAANADGDAQTAVNVNVHVDGSVGSQAPCRTAQGRGVTSSRDHQQHLRQRQQEDQEYPHRQRLVHGHGRGQGHQKSRSTDSNAGNSSYSSAASSTSRTQESSSATSKTTSGDFATFIAQAESKAANERAFRNRMARRERLDAAVQGIAPARRVVPAHTCSGGIPCSVGVGVGVGVGTKRDSAYYSVGSNSQSQSQTNSSISGRHHHQLRPLYQQQQAANQSLNHKTSRTLPRRISEYFKPSTDGGVAMA